MTFEPNIPGVFEAELTTQVTDPHGLNPSTTVIQMDTGWHLRVRLNIVHGEIMPLLCGNWQVRAYLESIGPGPEPMVLNTSRAIDGNGFDFTVHIPANTPNVAGPYKLVTVVTSVGNSGQAGIFAGYSEGPILQFYDA